MKIVRAIAIFFLIGLFLTTEIMPGLTQLPPGKVTKAQNLVQQGRNYYQAEKFHQASDKLEQAADIFAELEELDKEAITRGNLSLAYQQQGNWQEAKNAIALSLTLLNFKYDLDNPTKIPDLPAEKLQILAKIINIYGRLWYFQGNLDNALSSWQLATNIYQQLEDRQGIVTSQINQIQALQTLGLYQEAKKIGQIVEQNFKYLPDNLKFQGLLSLGNIYRSLGDLANSEKYLQATLELAQNNSYKNTNIIQLSLADTWHSWGNLERERVLPIRYEYIPWRCEPNDSLSLPVKTHKFYEKAKNMYRQVLKQERSPVTNTTIKSQLNLLKLLITTGQWSEAMTLSKNIKLSDLTNNRTKVYSQINYAKSLACIKQQYSPENISWNKITPLIETAIKDAEDLKDMRAKSYALGNLGGLYEYFALLAQRQQQDLKAQQWIKQAQKLTQQALYSAQPSQVPDIAYQWQWQLGRLLEAQEKTQESITYYQSAVQTLESVRGDLLTINSDVQFSFRDNIEPVYRQLAQLLLQQPIPDHLAQTREVIQNLQLAELENFLRCNIESNRALDKIVNRPNSTEAVIYPIILDGQIDVILKLPNSDELRYHNTKLSQGEVEEVLQRLQDNLAKPQGKKKVQEHAEQVYQWLIAPFATDLETAKVDTLVFFLDTPLRNIPMAVLYDGNKYLIEKYAVAVTSGLELREPKTLQRERLNAMLAGLTESRQGYPPLKNVDLQLNQISAEIPSQILLDREFTVSSFQNQLQSLPFPVVHIATHGQFSSQPEETFIIAWDKPIDVNELSILLKNTVKTKSEAIELLVLAACQTAKGDKRATLGLAGVAINAGVRSTLATLWKVIADESPGELLSQFYQELSEHPDLTKAEALRRAQLEFLQDDSRNRPYYWATYILLGNWL